MTTRHWHGGELRWDHLAGEWAILAPGRSARPHDRSGETCPFCPGPGEDTPPETWRLPAPDGRTWRVRAVPNRYALSDRHEVVIESPRHDWDLALATDEQAADLCHAWQQRHRALRHGAAQVVVFRNRGHTAGTSLSHPHSQAVGLPVLSAATRREMAAMREHYDRARRPFAEELSSGDRLVLAEQHAIAFVPFAPAAEFEVRIAPTHRRADFAAVPDNELHSVARVLRSVLAALRDELHDPAYNLIVHTAPVGLEQAPYLCWSLRIVPRLAIPAGLELATGIPVVTTTPDEAARRLRARLRAG